MGLRKAHERLENCICSWVAEPIEVKYEYKAVSDITPLDVTMSDIQYVRAMVHHINPRCTVHAWLLNPVGYMAKPLPKISSIAVDAVPMANRPEARVTFENSQDDGNGAPAQGYEVLVEEGGVVSRQTVQAMTDRAVDDTDREQLIARAREVWEEFRHEHGDKMQWVIDYAKAMTTSERQRIKYEARKRSEWYFCPLDDPMGQGHCRSCHHDCRFEEHIDARGNAYRCEEPSCGHWIGCPGC